MKRTPAALAATALLAVACSRAADDFRLVEVIPAPGGAPLRLNEELTLVFSADVDPSSVSDASVAVLKGDGAPARGLLSVAGARVTFAPEPVRSAALDDGGFGPGGSARVSLMGFPARSAVRSARGTPLAGAYRADFRVTDPRAAGGPKFVDRDPGPPRVLARGALDPGGGAASVRPGGWVQLTFSEPLLPGSVQAATIRLYYDNPDRTPVEAELFLDQSLRGARVYVRPRGGFERGTHYLLDCGAPGVVDLAGEELAEDLTLCLRAEDAGPAIAGAAGPPPANLPGGGP